MKRCRRAAADYLSGSQGEMASRMSVTVLARQITQLPAMTPLVSLHYKHPAMTLYSGVFHFSGVT